MTPSEAHDTAWKREPSHDKMTVDCMLHLEKYWTKMPWSVDTENRRELPLAFIAAEFYLKSGERGGGFFADIFCRWDFGGENIKEKRVDGSEYTRPLKPFSVYGAFEIKPKIYSAGAVLRQVRVQRARMRAWAGDDNYDSHKSFVECIVSADDPLIGTLVQLSRSSVLAWDGDRLKRIRWEPHCK